MVSLVSIFMDFYSQYISKMIYSRNVHHTESEKNVYRV